MDLIPQTQTVENLKDQGEIAREHLEYDKALGFFDQALVAAAAQKNYTEIAAILAHKIVIYKNLFENTANDLFLEMMDNDALIGLRICEKYNVTGEAKSVMHVRVGDFFYYSQNYPQAIRNYDEGLLELPQDADSATRGEYMGYQARALASSGRREDAFFMFETAMQLVQNGKLRPFHLRSVHAGLLLRYAMSLAEAKQDEKAQQILAEAKTIAEQLASEDNMAYRLNQVHQLAAKYGWNI